ncbi:hypothetical protein [Dactylosporangium darangshiense]|uniref:hypothetical protein n=1 Tax=Dactylosporangium darangshiense TaxID=579108 RepID=UPI00363B659F
MPRRLTAARTARSASASPSSASASSAAATTPGTRNASPSYSIAPVSRCRHQTSSSRDHASPPAPSSCRAAMTLE